MFVNARAIIEREGKEGTEILLQIRNKVNERKALEIPGGRIEEYESIIQALKREVYEETGLKVTQIKDNPQAKQHRTEQVSIEGVQPYFVYQTTKGPVDSVGFIFRVEVEDRKTSVNDESFGHRWVKQSELKERLESNPDDFDWLSKGILDYYYAILEKEARLEQETL